MHYDYIRWRSYIIGLIGSEKGLVHLGFYRSLRAFRSRVGQARRSPELFNELKERILRYLSREKISIDHPIDLRGTRFQLMVWLKVKEIPYGETRTYKWVAEGIGKPRAYRAVGSALKRNPIMLIIPCHRVIREDGRLGGSRYGVELRRMLLRIEGVKAD